MTHPLAAISRNALVDGYLESGVTNGFDAKGNPIISKTRIRLQIMIKSLKDQMYFRSLYSVDNTRKIVEIYIQKGWYVSGTNLTKINLNNLNYNEISQNLSSLNETLKFTIVDRNQSNLVIITSVFGKKLVAIQDGYV